MQSHTFSIVICTFKRAAFVGKAIESAFAQDYPNDRYEIIVINNDSPDNTEEVVRRYAERSPVPFSYHLERRNGLSHARNLGIEKSRSEYVAFLDDDATACPGWLSSFDQVIREKRALVVGGRVEIALAEGFTPPPWFQGQYLRGFFGINYRDWGKKETLFRIRPPLYIGGGNSAYARRLFSHFGAFSPWLGRDGKTLLAGEESFFNLVLDRYDIPIYYTDAAVIHHFIEPYRITKRHLRQKAHWSGITNALIAVGFHGMEAALQNADERWEELKRRTREIRQKPGDVGNFGRHCRVLYNLSYLRKLHLLASGEVSLPQVHLEANWGPREWIAEVSRWPECTDKYTQLHSLHEQLGEKEQAAEAQKKLQEYQQASADRVDLTNLGKLAGPLRQVYYERVIKGLRETVEREVPRGAWVLVASKGDDALTTFDGRLGWHFPQEPGGAYAGHYPATSVEAISHLEAQRERGAEFLVFPATALWWLDHYPELARHLQDRYRIAARFESCVLFDLRGEKAIGENGRKHAVRDVPLGIAEKAP
jgi:glycosyltransferase involved in cell wall biosynthesis